MKPIEFPEQTTVLAGRHDIAGLPIWGNGSICVSCWKPTLRDRLAILLGAKIWVSVLSGKTQPPIGLQAVKSFFKTAEWKAENPKKPGWYQVRWTPEEPPVTVYVSEIHDDHLIWGWSETEELVPLKYEQLQEWRATWLAL